jgi:hypothetical protein
MVAWKSGLPRVALRLRSFRQSYDRIGWYKLIRNRRLKMFKSSSLLFLPSHEQGYFKRKKKRNQMNNNKIIRNIDLHTQSFDYIYILL